MSHPQTAGTGSVWVWKVWCEYSRQLAAFVPVVIYKANVNPVQRSPSHQRQQVYRDVSGGGTLGLATFQLLSKTNNTRRHSDANAGPWVAANNRRGAQSAHIGSVHRCVDTARPRPSPSTSCGASRCVPLLDLCTVPAPLTHSSNLLLGQSTLTQK